MGKNKSTQEDGVKPQQKTQELEKIKNIPRGFYKDGVESAE